MSRLTTPVAALFALALGVALGAGPLGEDRGDASPHRRAAAPAAGAFGDAFATAAAPSLYARRLAHQSVAVVTTPGVPPATVKALTDQVVAAGGAVSSRTALTESLTADGQKTLVDTMGSQLAAQLRTQVPALADPALTTYPRMGRLIGLALASTGGAGAPGAPASTVRESLHAARLTSDTGSAGVAPLVLLVLGSDLDDAIVTGLVQGLAPQAHGLVVAGTSRSADITAVGAEAPATVATVDGVETAPGRVATTLALVHQVAGGGGRFGVSGADGVLPSS